MNKQIKLSLLTGSALLLTACSPATGDITGNSSSFWEQIVYFFGQMILKLSFGGLVGIGIILFTILIRLVLLPLYNFQIKSNQKMQLVQPKLTELQAKYPGKDMESRTKMLEEQQALFKEHGVNPYAGLWPLFIQMPVLIALFQALTRVEALRQGHFLWMDIAKPDPYFILPILAAALTFASSWLTAKASPVSNSSLKAMTYIMPIMILLIGLGMASGVALYWTVSNAFQVGQILVFNNPFKIIAEREAEARAIKEREAKIRQAKKKAKKRR